MNQFFCFQIQSLNYRVYSLIIFLLSITGYTQNVIITEIYRDPPGSETALGGGASHEFIEITNLGCDTFSLKNLLITDGVDTDSLIMWDNVIFSHQECFYSQDFLLPGQTALILDSDYSKAVQENHAPPFSIEKGTVLLRVDDRDLGNGLAVDDGIVLYRGDKKNVIEIIANASDGPVYLDNPVPGKISLSNPKNREGFSVTPYMFLFDSVHFSYKIDTLSPGKFDELNNGLIAQWKFCSVDINNQQALPCSVLCLRINDNAGLSVPWCLESVFGLETHIVDKGVMRFGNQKGVLVFDLPLDNVDYYLTIDTNRWYIDISSVWSPAASIVISEIFPKATQNEPEWIELFNQSSKSINLKNWMLGNSEDTIEIIGRDFYLESSQYVVITKNTKSLNARYLGLNSAIEPFVWHTLNNTSDTIMLLNPQSVLIDIICYNKKWFNSWPSGSLERIKFLESGCDSLLWEPALITSPGMPNGAQFYRLVDKPFFDIGPVPFTPDNDGKDDYLQISLKLPLSYSIVSLAIFSFNGRMVYEINDIKQGVFLWNGKERNGKPVINGPIFVAAELKYPKGTMKLLKKGVLWR